MSGFGAAVFHTTSAAIKAEKVLKEAGIDVRPIPVPRQFSADCGIAIRFNFDQLTDVEAILRDAGVEVAGLHEL